MGERVILHSDLNAFYASVEMRLNPSLRGKAVAVCGSDSDRHGIVLAKSELAKKAGVKTAMVTWQARQLCPDLITVPPQYEQYLTFSKLTREIYQRYTDQVEPYGMDECFIDVTGSTSLFGDGPHIAEEIRRTVREELGLTVSVGVSFNKVFAKLGSDLKKPDAVSTIDREHYRQIVWPLPASDLFFVGPATAQKLAKLGVYTIGALAAAPREALKRAFGVGGDVLWRYANGEDRSQVMRTGFEAPVKSIGHGITCTADLYTCEEAWRVLLALSQDIGHKLRLHGFAARGAQLTVKDNSLECKQYQAQFSMPTQNSPELARMGLDLLRANYGWELPVRALTIRAINLIPKDRPQQLSLFENMELRMREEKLDEAIDGIRDRFGWRSIMSASLLGDLKTASDEAHEIILPGMMYS